MGSRVDIEGSAQVGANEMPYWMLQCIPERIRYTMKGNTLSLPTFLPILTGPTGYNYKLQFYLEQLEKMGATDPMGKLVQALLAYDNAVTQSADPRKDKTVEAELEKFQRQAHMAKNYKKLPVKACRAMFFNGTPVWSGPRLTPKEHQDMG